MRLHCCMTQHYACEETPLVISGQGLWEPIGLMAPMAPPAPPLQPGLLYPKALRQGALLGAPRPVPLLHWPQNCLHGDQCRKAMGGR